MQNKSWKEGRNVNVTQFKKPLPKREGKVLLKRTRKNKEDHTQMTELNTG